LHSRFFLRAEDYKYRRVLVVGSFASGSEVARLVAELNLTPRTAASTNGGGAGDGLSSKFEHGREERSNGNGSQSERPEVLSQSNGKSSNERHETHNATHTPVFVSTSGESNNYMAKHGDPSTPWVQHITYVPLISHLSPPSSSHPNGLVHFHPYPSDDSHTAPEPIEVDTIVYATGYNNCLPFFKVTDSPWNVKKVLGGTVQAGERIGGDQEDVGGLKGLTMKELDETLLFLDGDRSIAFPVLRKSRACFGLAI
jgi:hypothetical protein